MAKKKQEDLSDSNLLIYAMRNYINTQCRGIEEFSEDMSIPIHIKKLFTRYHVNNELKENLIINHIISFFNVFEPEAALKILFFKIDKDYYIYLKTFLVFLNRCPDFITLETSILNLKALPIDPVLIAKLKETSVRK